MGRSVAALMDFGLRDLSDIAPLVFRIFHSSRIVLCLLFTSSSCMSLVLLSRPLLGHRHTSGKYTRLNRGWVSELTRGNICFDLSLCHWQAVKLRRSNDPNKRDNY